MMRILFWFSALYIAYVYLGYPLLLIVWAAAHRETKRPSQEVSELPSISMIISAYNEERVIEKKIQNSLSLDYPKLEILIVSDCSNDNTDRIVERYTSRGVVLLRLPKQSGKTAGLNFAVPQSTGEILVFSDANALYEADAILRLVQHFTDPSIGYVTGNARYIQGVSAASKSESLYWRYERWLKRMETRCGGMVGADGAIYAARRALYQPLKPHDINDLVNPLQIVAQGYRGVFEPDAICFEQAAGSFAAEFRRKVRIVSRSLRGVWQVRRVLHPIRHASFAFKLISHKLMRWFVPVSLIGLFVTNGWLLIASEFYAGIFLAQLGFYGLAFIGFLLSRRRSQIRVFYVPYYFCLINFAALLGIFRAFTGNVPVVWQPER